MDLGVGDHAEQYAGGLLTGACTRLRPLHDDDVPVLEGWWNDPAVAVFQNPAIRPQPAGPAAELFRRCSANGDSGSVGFSVVSRDDEALVGHAVVYGAEVGPRSGTAAIVIGPGHTSRGYGTDALRTLLRYAFDEMGLHRLGLEVFSFNTRAIATYRKLGFREEGRRRESIFRAGHFHDEIMMGLLEPEWRSGLKPTSEAAG